MAGKRLAILFDIDGTLITTGGAGATSWRLAFDELYGIPADIGKFTDAGMTDPDVGRRTFEAVMHRPPERQPHVCSSAVCITCTRLSRTLTGTASCPASWSCGRAWSTRGTCSGW